MLVTWALGDGPVHTWDLTRNWTDGDLLGDLAQATQIRAANAPFDKGVLSARVQGFPLAPEMWACLLVRAYRNGWPRGGLAYLCEQLGLNEEDSKIKEGKRLIQMFCKPRKPSKNIPTNRYTHEHKPEEWERFCEYGRQDVVALRECWRRLPDVNETEFEHRLWNLDQDINTRGWPICRATVVNANRLINEEKAAINQRLVTLTKGTIERATEVEKIRQFIEQHNGRSFPTCTAEDIDNLLADPTIDEVVRAVADCRHEGSRATNAKYRALELGTSDDDRLRYSFQYGGAPRTLRWSGRKFQPHNLIRPAPGWDARKVAELVASLNPDVSAQMLNKLLSIPVLEWLAYGIRGAIKAPEGYHLVTGDLSQIEARMVNWLAGNQAMLDVFADPKQDPYVFAAQKVGSADRQLGKVQTLSCGYGIGGDGYTDIANKPPYSLGISYEMGKEHVTDWRNANPELADYDEGLWAHLNAACIRALKGEGPQVVRRLYIQVWNHEGITYLGIRLPCNRWVCYPHAHVEWHKGRDTMVYLGDYGMQRTHGGPLTGIVTQSSARDKIAEGMLRAQDVGFQLIGHVHDESIALVKDTDTHLTPELMNQCLTAYDEWTDGLPLASDCNRTIRYAKL